MRRNSSGVISPPRGRGTPPSRALWAASLTPQGALDERRRQKRQPACKPGSVWPGCWPRRDGHSSGTPVAGRLKQPTRATWPTDKGPAGNPRVAPIRSCSRRGLPCRRRCRRRGALLPHPFTLALTSLAARFGRFAFCGAFPGVAPAGRYPAPHPYGARTFLRFREAAAVRPTGSNGHMSVRAGRSSRKVGRLMARRVAGDGTGRIYNTRRDFVAARGARLMRAVLDERGRLDRDATLVHCSFTLFVGLCAPGRRLACRRGARRNGATLSTEIHGPEIVCMKRMLALSLALAAAVSVAACETPQQNNALVGGTLGAGTGALIGSAVSGGNAGSTIAGAALGAGTGAMIGAAATPQPAGRCARFGYDYNGNRVCVAYY